MGGVRFTAVVQRGIRRMKTEEAAMQTPEAVERFNPRSWDETAVRGMEARQKGQHLVGLHRDGRAIYADTFTETPSAVEKPVVRANLTATAEFYAATQGFTLVRYTDSSERAVFARPLPAVTVVRDAIARELKVPAHSVAITVEWSEQEPRAERVLVRLPATGIAEDRRAGVVAEVLKLIPGSSSGWTAETDAYSNVTAYTYGAPRVLPEKVFLADLLPEQYDPDGWTEVPLGIAADGSTVAWRPRLQPHGLIAGTTGSGKTQGLFALMAGGLARGYEFVVCDPTKGGSDYVPLDAYMAARPRNLAEGATQAEAIIETAAIVKAVYAEGVRRQKLCLSHKNDDGRTGVNFWAKLPKELREREGIRPLVLILDEYKSLLAEVDVPKMAKGSSDPELEAEIAEAQALVNAKATISLYVGKLAREMRAWGVYTWLALQKAEQDALGKDLRENLPARVQYVLPGQAFPPEVLKMLFPDEAAAQAAVEIAVFDDRKTQGLGVMTQANGPTGFRGGFMPDEQLPELPRIMERLGVPKPRQLPVNAAASRGLAAPAEQVDPWA